MMASSASNLLSPGLRCWVVTDGKVGMEVQCRGLAEALGLTPEIKRASPTAPWCWMPPSMVPKSLHCYGRKRADFQGPWPDLLIASGRQSVAASVAVRRAGGGRTFTVQVQNPRLDPAHFDLVVVPEHDALRGPNVLVARGALGRVTDALLQSEAARHGARFAALPRPRLAVLIGGNNKVFALTRELMLELAGALARLSAQGWGLMVTVSRRTGPEAASLLQEQLAGVSAVICDGAGDNPYFGILGLADAILVTGDSVNMVCEAAGTGKPLHVFDLEGGSAKFERFHSALRDAGIARPFAGTIEDWTYEPLRETQRIAPLVAARLLARAAA